MSKAKTKQRERVNTDSFESLDKPTQRFSFTEDVLKGAFKDAREQLSVKTKESGSQKAGDLVEGEEISFRRTEVKKNTHLEAGINYGQEIIHAERRVRQENNQVIAVQIEEVLIELKKLAKTSKTLETQFRTVTTITMPKAPGKYHQNFFEWMLSVIKGARTRVESAEQWLKAISGKGKKKDFWGLYKKHGTSFGLSGERAVAQQTG